jgi:hypothetical protein
LFDIGILFPLFFLLFPRPAAPVMVARIFGSLADLAAKFLRRRFKLILFPGIRHFHNFRHSPKLIGTPAAIAGVTRRVCRTLAKL